MTFEYSTELFQISSQFEPAGDQPRAIEQLVQGLTSGKRCQTLMGGNRLG
jgi:excinuclease ABC subunit B